MRKALLMLALMGGTVAGLPARAMPSAHEPGPAPGSLGPQPAYHRYYRTYRPYYRVYRPYVVPRFHYRPRFYHRYYVVPY